MELTEYIPVSRSCLNDVNMTLDDIFMILKINTFQEKMLMI